MRWLWDNILEHFVKKTRENVGHKENPCYTIIDSQIVKTVATSEERGIDGRKIKGRKRHIVIDVLGVFATRYRSFIQYS